jgi:ribosomal protein L7/L12
MFLEYFGIGLVLAIVYYIIKAKMSSPRKNHHISHDAHDDEDVEVLAQSGRKLAAIKAYSKLHGVGLDEAKEFVDSMLTEGFHASNHIDDDMNLSTDEEILRTAKSGHKISAIKIYREFYGVGLKEAKEAVETMLRNEN